MHTSNISAVLPVAPKNAAQTPNDDHADSTSPDASFSSVLTRQNGNEPVRETTSSGHRSTDKKGASDTQGDPASSSDAALVQEAAEQGLTLPQIALNIASEVAAVRQSGLANALKSHGITEPTTRNAAHAERDIHTLLSRLPADATPKTTAATAREQLGTELAAKAKILPDALPTDRSKG